LLYYELVAALSWLGCDMMWADLLPANLTNADCVARAARLQHWRIRIAQIPAIVRRQERQLVETNMPTLKAAIIPVTPLQQNCAVIWDDETKVGAVVDPGGDVDQIVAALGETGAKIEQILLTHGHVDHAAGAADLKERLDVPIVGPDLRDKFLLQSLAAQCKAYGISSGRDVLPDSWLEEGDTVAVGPFTFDVFHCPGHTPGHLVFVDRKLGFALVGDVLFQGSIGRTDFPYGDGPALIDAVRTKLFPLGDEIGFICGHGPGSTIGEERRNNPFVGERTQAEIR
jgi:glyoxylase-like metal-dependent hydrolase (beta-lactamase superfamily II)